MFDFNPRRLLLATMMTMAAVCEAPFTGTVALAAPGPAMREHLPQRLDTTIDRALAGHRIVGAVVLVMQGGHLIYHRAAGFLEALRTGGSPILKAGTVTSMMTNQVGAKAILSGPGWGFGFGAAVVTDPVVAMTDTAPEGDSGPFAMQIRQAVYGRVGP